MDGVMTAMMGKMGLGLLGGLLLLVLAVLGIAALVRGLARDKADARRENSALDIPKKGYARGEIGREEFKIKSAPSHESEISHEPRKSRRRRARGSPCTFATGIRPFRLSLELRHGPQPECEHAHRQGTFMRKPRHFVHSISGALLLMPMTAPFAAGDGDAARGARVFGACAACHSIEPGQHATGPSLAHVWGKKAGSAEGFSRYSDALGRSGVVWDEKSLDAWLTNPAKFIPGNAMPFPGVPDSKARSDVIAYLEAVSEGKAPPAAGGGMMHTPRLADLKQANAESRVTVVRYCKDTYEVSTGANKVLKFWEFNLRLKTDSSASGPLPGQPVLVPQGMGGDRAQLVFSNPGEISTFIKRCS